MKDRLVKLAHWLWHALLAMLRGIGSLLGALLAWLSRQGRLLATRGAMRAKERERRQRLETIGGMVFILFKRSLVRNHDLLVECEKVRDIDVEIDALLGQIDSIRTERRPRKTPELPRMAAQTAETDAAATGVTTLETPGSEADTEILDA